MSAAYPRPFARYTLLAQLGEGGMGVVHRAIDPALGVEVALKTCRPELAEGEDLARFMREGRLLAQLRHPHLVSLLDVGVHEGTPYLVMELVRGRDLQHRLREGPFAPQEAVEVVRKLAEAAGALHAQGVVHRDVKPGNVLLTPDGEPVLTDLGLARGVETHSLTRTGAFVGTPAYLAPEQARGNPVDAAADVYALGVLLFELLSGRLPFNQESPLAVLHAHQRVAPPRLRTLAPHVAPQIEAVVARCLEKQPAARYADGAELAAALAAPAPASARPREVPLLVAGAILALLSASAALAVVLRTGQTPAPPTQTPTPAPTPEPPEPSAPDGLGAELSGVRHAFESGDYAGVLEQLAEEPLSLVGCHYGFRASTELGLPLQALEWAARATEAYPQAAEAWHLMLRAREELQEIDAALEAGERAWALEPVAATALAAARLQLDRWDGRGAEAWIERGLEAFPQDADLAQCRVVLRFQRGDAAAEAALLVAADEKRALRSERLEPLLALASVYAARGDYARGRPFLAQLQRIAKDHVTVSALEGDYALAEDDLFGAITAFEDGFSQAPGSGWILGGMARVFARLGATREAAVLAQFARARLDLGQAVGARRERLLAPLAELEPEEPYDLTRSAAAWLALAREREQDGNDPVGAQLAFRACAIRDPGADGVWLGLGRACLQRGITVGDRHLRRALLRRPRDPETLHFAALSALGLGDLERARLLTHRLSQLPDCAGWQAFLAGEWARVEGREEDALARYRRALDLGVDSVLLFNRALTLLLRQRRLDAARDLVERWGRGPLHLERGAIALVAQDLETARAEVARELELHPRSSFALLYAGRIARESGDTAEARRYFHQALAEDPLRPGGWVELLKVDLAGDDGAVLDRDFARYASVAPVDALVEQLCVRAFDALERGRWPRRRLEWTRRATELSPQALDPWRALATVAGIAEEREEAASACRRVLELDPDDAFAHLYLGREALDRGDFAGARRHTTVLLRVEPEVWGTWLLHGRLQVLDGEVEAGWALLERAVAAAPTSAAPRFTLLQVARELGRWEEVQAQLEALEDLPGVSEVQRAELDAVRAELQAHLPSAAPGR